MTCNSVVSEIQSQKRRHRIASKKKLNDPRTHSQNTLSTSCKKFSSRIKLPNRSLSSCLPGALPFQICPATFCSNQQTPLNSYTCEISSDKQAHISKHLRRSDNSLSFSSEECLKISTASKRYQFKIKEAMHILWEQPSLNVQVKHYNLSLLY